MTSLEKKMMKLIISSINTNKKENGLFDLLVKEGCDPEQVQTAFDCWKIEQLGGKKPRAPSAYLLWCKDHRDGVITHLSTTVEGWENIPQAGSKEDGVKGRMGMISGELGKRWKDASKKTKKKYNKKHEAEKLEIEEKTNKKGKVDKKGKEKKKEKVEKVEKEKKVKKKERVQVEVQFEGDDDTIESESEIVSEEEEESI